MGDLWRTGELAQSMVVIATTVGFPPFSSGAFWGIMSLWGIIQQWRLLGNHEPVGHRDDIVR